MELAKNLEIYKILEDNFKIVVGKILSSHFSESLFSEYEMKVTLSLDVAQESFVAPLVKLLKNVLKNGDADLLAIYIDERKRYSPHLKSLEIQLKFHKELVDRDYKLLSEIPKFKDNVTLEQWQSLHSTLITPPEKSLKLLAVGDCLMNEIRVFCQSFNESRVAIDFRCMYFSAASAGGLDVEKIRKYILENGIEVVSFSFFSFEVMPAYNRLLGQDNIHISDVFSQCDSMLNQMRHCLNSLRSSTEAVFFVHNASGLPLTRWRKYLDVLNPLSDRAELVISYLNHGIAKIIKDIPNVISIDELSVIRSQGGYRKNSKSIVSQRLYGGYFHTSNFGKHLADVYKSELSDYYQLKKCKALLIDFDNTLWEGVMAEGDVRHYSERQALLKRLASNGIVLVAVSKNSEENIRWSEMILKEEDFALKQIHWGSKADSVEKTAKILNLGKDSFVFVDDNRMEREIVRSAHPEVVLFDAEDELSWVRLQKLFQYPNTQSTEEALARTKAYQDQAQRVSFLDSDGDFSAGLHALGLVYSFRLVEERNLDRVAELVNRTNQFNLTTKRYKKSDLLDMLENGNHYIFVVTLKDKFGDLGMVGAVIVKKLDELTCEIDSLVMSCRAMGFGLEKEMVANTISFMRNKGFDNLIASYIPTPRNSPCASLYADLGLPTVTENNYSLEFTSWQFESVPWLKFES